MSPHFRLKNHLLLAALATAYPMLGHAATAARVEFATGNVMAVSTSGTRPLARGSELNTGETINTGEGRAQLRFADGAMMSLQPQTEFRIDDYNYNGKNDGQEKGFFSLLRGGLRTISGYIGKGNRDAYKVTTSVATIGIRGTEWSGVLIPAVNPGDVELNVGTGEGAIEVCNGAGCIVVASGESAVVTGNTQPRRSNVNPSLPPAATTNKTNPTPVYTEGDQRAPDGGLAIVEDNKPTTTPPPPTPTPTGFTSGSGYSVAVAGRDSGGYAFTGTIDLGDATFAPSPGEKLQEIAGGSDSYKIVQGSDMIAAVHSSGVIGWGVWSQGTNTYQSEGPVTQNIQDVHFIIGKGTSAADLAGLMPVVGTFTKVGNTTPASNVPGATLSNSSVESAKLTAYFAGPNTTLDLDMSVKAGTRTYNVAVNDMYMTGTSTFSGGTYGTTWTDSDSGRGGSSGNTGEGWTSVSGIFAGPKASHAGISYSIEDWISSTKYTTVGAVGFERDPVTAAKFSSGGGLAFGATGTYFNGEGYSFAADVDGPVSLGFSDGKLSSAAGNTYSFAAGSVSQVVTITDADKQAVLGWGKWAGGTATYESAQPLVDAHYVVGKAMTSSQFNAMSGSFSYNKVGGTTPTTGNGGTGTLNSANLSATFNAGSVNVNLNVNVTANGHTYDASGSGSSSSGKFSGSGVSSVNGSSASASFDFNGLFAGKNAKFAGVTYGIREYGDSYKTVNGAIGFVRGGQNTN